MSAEQQQQVPKTRRGRKNPLPETPEDEPVNPPPTKRTRARSSGASSELALVPVKSEVKDQFSRSVTLEAWRRVFGSSKFRKLDKHLVANIFSFFDAYAYSIASKICR